MAINVTVVYNTSHPEMEHEYEMRVAPDVPVRRLIPSIVGQIKETSSMGDSDPYPPEWPRLLKYGGRVLSPEETLAQAGVTDGAKIEVIAVPYVPFSSVDFQHFRDLIGWIIYILQETLARYEDFYRGNRQDRLLDDWERAAFYAELETLMRLVKRGTPVFLDRKCPSCWIRFQASEEMVCCQNCLLVMHKTCWKGKGCCPVCGGQAYFNVPRPL